MSIEKEYEEQRAEQKAGREKWLKKRKRSSVIWAVLSVICFGIATWLLYVFTEDEFRGTLVLMAIFFFAIFICFGMMLLNLSIRWKYKKLWEQENLDLSQQGRE